MEHTVRQKVRTPPFSGAMRANPKTFDSQKKIMNKVSSRVSLRSANGIMNCLVVDDDKITRKELEKLISGMTFLNLAGNCAGAREAFNIMETTHIDLLFLDVMMPDMTGLQLLRTIHHARPTVILISKNKSYAYDAFDYDVTDFLAKPISGERFHKAVSKAKEIYESEHQPGELHDYIFVKQESLLVKININEILHIEVLDNYIRIHTEKNNHVIRLTLKAIADKLPEKYFLRVHRSFMVRLDKISHVDENTIVIGQNFIPIGRSYKEELIGRLQGRQAVINKQ